MTTRSSEPRIAPLTGPATAPADAAAQRTHRPVTQVREVSRLAWLDALRGVAALMVAIHHASYDYTPRAREAMLQWFDPGTYGVMVFFLVSGYIIPASLERSGSVRRFWISRLFRIYPLWAVACAMTVALMSAGLYGSRGGPGGLIAAIAHVTMLQDLLAVPSMLNVLWTLSYEMAFYLLTVALFMLGVHRRSTAVALVFSIAGVLLGGILPTAALSQNGNGDMVIVIAAIVMAGAIVLASRGRVLGGVAGGSLALVLVMLNGRVSPGEGLVILAVMFTGTGIYRAEQAQIGRRAMASTLAVVLTATLVTGVWSVYGQDTQAQRAWCLTIVSVAATFGLGLALRRRRIPRWLTSLGRMSFSVYLLHPVLLAVMRVVFGKGPERPGHGSVPLLVLFVLALLALSWTAWRLVEAPMQRLGRRLR
jgi:peptidoglycan/LPS O-acetylase OafA/YrhL